MGWGIDQCITELNVDLGFQTFFTAVGTRSYDLERVFWRRQSKVQRLPSVLNINTIHQLIWWRLNSIFSDDLAMDLGT